MMEPAWTMPPVMCGYGNSLVLRSMTSLQNIDGAADVPQTDCDSVFFQFGLRMHAVFEICRVAVENGLLRLFAQFPRITRLLADLVNHLIDVPAEGEPLFEEFVDHCFTISVVRNVLINRLSGQVQELLQAEGKPLL